MLKRLLAVIIAALLAPVPTVWVLYQYGEWLFARFQDIGLNETASGLAAMLFVCLASIVLIAAIFGYLIFNDKKAWNWIKTGEYRA